MVKTSYFTNSLSRHFYYFLGFQLINAIVHLIILSFIAFFHFLLDHRMADIQDWVFFHGWEVLAFGKLISLVVIFRFLGILSIERRPLIHLLQFNRGFWRPELVVVLAFSLAGILIIGSPSQTPGHELSFYRMTMNSFGICVFYLSEALLVLSLNKWIPLTRKQWLFEIFSFSIISFVIHKSLFVFGQGWDTTVIFMLLMTLFLLRFRGDFSWLHCLIYTGFFIVPLAIFFGIDPLWHDKFSPFQFAHTVGAIEVGVFTLLAIFYLQRRRVSRS